jgi:hypothetical protein
MWTKRLFTILFSIRQPARFLSVLIGFIAAGLWTLSASVDIPLSPGAAIGGTSPDEPFNVAMQQAAYLNKYAAFATAISTLLLMTVEIIEWITAGRVADAHKP